MAVAITIDSVIASDPASGLDRTTNTLVVEGTLVFSGSYGYGSPVTAGEALDLTGFAAIVSSLGPKSVDVFQYPLDANAPIAYDFVYGSTAAVPTQPTGVVYIFDKATGAQISTGAYPSPLTAATTNIRFRARFPLDL